jgi:hypothetical protein
MFYYRFYRELEDRTWRVQIIPFGDDDEAINYAIGVRTADRCELYQAERWVATFDGARVHGHHSHSAANENETRDAVTQ